MYYSKKVYIWGAVSAVFIVIVLSLLFGGSSSSVYKLFPLKRGDLQVSISATGTIEPEEVVDVGAQVAGMISSFGMDKNGNPVDYGSEVEEGTVLANIDDSLHAADVAQASAALKRAEADLLQSQAKLGQAERDWARAQKLGPSDALAKGSYDAYKASYEAAKASVAMSEAAIAQAQAALEKAHKNLGYCTIKSPVNGVIIDRRVNIGQTVVASFNAPSLFLIAKDLKKMQIWIAVNEADIGSIHPGQKVTFTVDAFPGEVFVGEVGKVRLNATMTQNVVTYTVEVLTDNASGRLLPYLTANARFDAGSRQDVLLVPNAALRWTPKEEQIDPEFEDSFYTHMDKHEAGKGVLWIPDGKYARPLAVKVGLSDGSFTEIEGQDLKEDIEIIIGELRKDDETDTNTTNPFAPRFPSRKKQ